MARNYGYYTKLATRMVNPIYGEQEKGLRRQISGVQTDPYYQSLIQGLESAKTKEFGNIEGRAAARGALYSTAPTQQQSAFVGEKFLPAMAEVKKTQSDRISQLQATLADLRSKRAAGIQEQANLLWKTDIERDEAAKERAAANWRASLSASGGSSRVTPQWKIKQLARQSAIKDIKGNLLDWVKGGKPAWYTEQTLLPGLASKYGDILTPNELSKLTYSIRKKSEYGGE